jgi:hypothetical protein
MFGLTSEGYMDWSGIVSWSFDLFAMTFFIATLCLLFMKRPVRNAGIAAILAAFCAIMGSPDRFKSLTFSPTTGIQMTARQAIQEVQVSIEQLRKLAASLAGGSFNDLAFSGQVFVGMSTREKFRVHDEMVARLQELGVVNADIKKTQHLWIYVYCDILEGMIVYRVKPYPNSEVVNEALQLPKDADMDGLPTPEVLRQWATSKSAKDPKIEEYLQEYNNVWTTGVMKNPDLIPFGASPMWAGIEKSPLSAEILKSDTGAAGAYNDGGVLATSPPPGRQ